MANFPASGGGPSSGPGLNPATIYVSPTGNDNNDGLSTQAAVRTGYVGYQKLQAAGGGRLYIAHNSSWGGPIPGQGMWIRGDGKNIPGWLQAVPSIIEGQGSATQLLFMKPGQAYLKCGSNLASDYRTKPGVWIAACPLIVDVKNIFPVPSTGYEAGQGFAHFRPWRIGWDYPRKISDGSIDYLEITDSSRAANVTTHTVTLPAGIAIESAQRGDDDYVRLTIPRPAGFASFPPYDAGNSIYFESNDEVNFPSGVYTIERTAWAVEVLSDWSFSIYSPGAETAEIPDAGTVKYTGLQEGQYLDLETDSAEFPSTQYKVTDVTIDPGGVTADIEVADIYGGHNSVTATYSTDWTGSDVHRLVHQERGTPDILGASFDNLGGYIPQTELAARYQSGPQFDIGSVNAVHAVFSNCLFQGYYPIAPETNVYDRDRMTSFFAGGGIEGGATFKILNCTGSVANVRYISGGFGTEVTIDLFSEGRGAGYTPPIYDVDLGPNIGLHIIQATVEALAGQGEPVISGNYDPLQITGEVPYASVGKANNAVGRTNSWAAGTAGDSPWKLGSPVTWADLKITGKHPAAWRGISPTMARFQNLSSAPADWDVTQGDYDDGQDDPMGGTGAVSITDVASSGTAAYVRQGTDTDTNFETGGRYVIAFWSKADPYHSALVCAFTGSGDLVWEDTGTASWTRTIPANIPGWQYNVFHNVVEDCTTGNFDYSIQLVGPPAGSGETGYFFGVSCFYVPPDISDNDFYEFIGTLKAQPYYLQPGMTGTFEGQKFIAHGGSGIDNGITKTVGVGSGQLTLTGSGTVYEPRYGADGTTIVGWVALLQATVNP